MSTQYGTLSHRKTVQVPMWLIVALVVGALAIGVGYSVEQYQGRGAVATSTVKAFPDTQVAAREGGAVLPATVDTPVFPGGLETSGVIPATVDTPVFPGGLETSGVIPSTGVGGAYPDTQVAAREGTPVETGTSVAAGGMSQPIVINGETCHQCR
ncbi:MAG: hypothetical protein ACXWYT_05380 [Actinomycetota bacterium]